ncbi:MAG TPA: LeuA family protein [Victivallales bacterium]|nr:LeuA family protein [Victivallales bacterium]
MEEIGRQDLIYPWNFLNYKGKNTRELLNRRKIPIEIVDETLRDGLQSPSAKTPSISEKIKILHYLNNLGVNMVTLGLPAAGEDVKNDVHKLAREVLSSNLRVNIACAARTVVSDIEPIVDITQKVGIPIDAHIFVGSSMIRSYVEGWNLDKLLRLTEESIKYCNKHNVKVNFVTEDTTRTEPRRLTKLLTTAIESGARRVCICDTVGYATPDGVRNIVEFVRKIIWDTGEKVLIDWHGHNDRGLGLNNALVAIMDAEVDRAHGTVLGIGERAGNAPLDLLLINLCLMGLYGGDLTSLGDLCKFTAKALDLPISYHYPAFGNDAFKTATGVHAAAIIKAYEKKEDNWFADYIYSSVPANKIGLKQKIGIGPMSGKSNVIFWLEDRDIKVKEKIVDKIYNIAKQSDHVLTDEEIYKIIK